MYRKISDFVNTWKAEAELTEKMFSYIPSEKLSEKVNVNIRTLGRLAWHIVQTVSELSFQLKLKEHDLIAGKSIPNTTEEIIAEYNKQSEELLSIIQENWKDDDLAIEVELYGEKWDRSRVLSMLVNHQIHHRGQMTVVMRLLGLKVPGIYGPSKEEWADYGAEPQE